MSSNPASMSVVQVAFTALEAERTASWYEKVFGLLPAGGMRGAAGADVAAMMGLPDVDCDMQWLVDAADFFQLEFFQFRAPASTPGSRTPADAGWSLVGLVIDDFDAIAARLRDVDADVGPVLGQAPDRRMCTRDPEGVWLELREREPGQREERLVRDVPVATAFVRAVVTDLAAAMDFFGGALALRETDIELHTDADEALWGAPISKADSRVLSSGGSGEGVLIELVHYADRVPAPLPDGYRICDQGILNVAFGSRDPDAYAATIERISSGGYRVNGELAIGPAKSSYVVGADGLSVELLTIPDPQIEREFGFLPSEATRSHQW